jgi:hypothetical protein
MLARVYKGLSSARCALTRVYKGLSSAMCALTRVTRVYRHPCVR